MESQRTEDSSDESSWWRRPSGGKEVLQVAFPLVVSTLSWTLMTYVDRAILSYYSPTAMAAAFSSAVLWFAFFCIFLGTCSYVNTFVAQYHGDDQPERIGAVVWQGTWLAMLSIPLALVLMPLAHILFSFAGHGPEVTEQEIIYFQILCLGGPGMVIAEAQSCFYSGRGLTRVVMLVDLLTTVINLMLDCVLIFGLVGFPEMGIAGAAWGTVFAFWLKTVIYFFLLRQEPHRRKFHTHQWKLELPLFRRLVYYGGPGGVQMLLDVAGFSVFVMLIGRLGDIPAQATTMAFGINTLSFMPVWGLGIATAILVGQRLGENRDDLAERATWTTYQLGMVYMAAVTLLYVALPDVFLEPFLQNESMSTADRDALRRMGTILLYFVAAYNMFDATQIILVSALKGAGDTRFIMLISLTMATTLAIMSYLAVEILGLNVYECWVLIVAWLVILAAVYLWRFRGGKWRHMRVIEQVHHRQGATCDEEPAVHHESPACVKA